MNKAILLRIVYCFIISSVCFCLQSTLFYRISIGYGTPDIMIIVTSAMGFMRGEREGMFNGLYCGLLMDLYGGTLFGYYMIIFMAIGYFCGIFSEAYYSDDIKLPLLLVGLSDIFYHLFIYVTIYLMRADLGIKSYFVTIIFPSVTYTLLCSLVIYLLLHLWNRRLENKARRSRQKFV